MARTIRLPQLPWHGTKDLEISLPDSWQVEVCNMAGYDRPALTEERIEAAVGNPIGAPPIRELARGKSEVVILFDDMARCTRAARVVPFILKELAIAGIPDSRIRFIAANGCHGPMNRIDFAKKLGEEVLTRFPVYNHNIYENCTHVGTTSNGTEVSINAEVMHCDFKIAVGITCPHPAVWFSGGAKMIIPGVASIDTTSANHSLGPITMAVQGAHASASKDVEVAAQASLMQRATLMYRDMEEAAVLAGLDLTVQCIVNRWGETIALYAGALGPAHEASVREAHQHYLTPKAVDKDIVIANVFAKANEAPLGLKAAGSVNGSGGDLVVIANAPDGQVVHYQAGVWGKSVPGWRTRPFPIPEQINRLILFGEYPDLASMGFFGGSPKVVWMTRWEDVLLALQEVHGERAEVAVYPNADILYHG